MKALGLDPGPSKTAFSWVHLDAGGWPHVVSGAHVENDSPELRKILQLAAMSSAPIGMETLIGWAYEASRVQQLVETARVEGRLEERALGFGGTVVHIDARSWRGALCGSPTASDKQIQIAIEGLVRTRPAVKADARAHLYDATGVALAVLAKSLGRTVTVPQDVMGKVHLQRETERASRGARKAAGLPVVEQTKRSPSRAQTKRRSDASKRVWAARKAGV
jgi:hypothetical protein